MNEYDSNRILDLTKKINYIKTNYSNNADCYVLNTCHIREKATDKVYHDVGRLKKEFRNKKKPIVIVTGCVAQAEGEILLKREKYIDAVIGPQSYHLFNKTILNLEKNSKKIDSTDFDVIDKFDNLRLIKNSNNKVSSYLTIQEGCDKFCNFCVVPYTRGSEFSRTFDDLIDEAVQISNNGAREITLLGQNVNSYNDKGKKLSHLIEEISKIKNIKRIRYTTSHPVDFTEDLISAHANLPKLMPQIHLPVQSGSNKILKKMNRKHTVERYLDLIKKLKVENPRVKFSSDFIIGYPDEDEKDFKSTIKLLQKVEYINAYSFIFSPRPGTPAAKMKMIDKAIAKKRLMSFQKIANEIKRKYRNNLISKISLVLFENELQNQKNYFFGRDEFSNPIVVESKENLVGKIKQVQINGGNQNTLFGRIIQNSNNREFAA